MILCEENLGDGHLVIDLYDLNNNLIASTYNKTTGKYYSEFQYKCSSTGLYYIVLKFSNTRTGCGMCILGFTR